MAVKDVILFFHAMPGRQDQNKQVVDWLGRPIKSYFKTPPVLIDCGSGRMLRCIDPKESDQKKCPKSGKGWGRWLATQMGVVPRSTSDPEYKANVVSTHFRPSILHSLVVRNSGGKVSSSDNLRVCLVGFSEGCQAIKALLSPQRGGMGMDAMYIDSVIAIDGIHCMKPSYVDANDGKTKTCSASCVRVEMEGYTAFANMAAWLGSPGEVPTRMMVVTNSSTAGPPCCYPTTWTSRFIYDNTISGVSANTTPALPPGVWDLQHNPPFVLPSWTTSWGSGPSTTYTHSHNDVYSGTGNLWILGYKNIDKPGNGHNDHIYQAAVVMPLMLEKFLAPRWKMPPESGVLVEV